jgi:hypothetical protein
VEGTVNLETEVPVGTRVEVAKVGRGAGVGTALIKETLAATTVASLTIVLVAVKKKLNGLTDLVVQKTKSL